MRVAVPNFNVTDAECVTSLTTPPETTEEKAMTKRAYDYEVNQELHDLVESAYPDGWMTAGQCIDIEQLQVQH